MKIKAKKSNSFDFRSIITLAAKKKTSERDFKKKMDEVLSQYDSMNDKLRFIYSGLLG